MAMRAAIACIAIFLCGCQSIVKTTPEGVEVGSAALSGLPARTVSFANGYKEESELKFSMPPHTLIVGPKHMTDTVVEALRRGFDKHLPPRSKSAAKRITLRVTSPRSAGAYPNPGVALSIEAVFGDGTRTLVNGEGFSGRGANRAFEAALQNGINRLLSDARFVAYMKR